MPIKIAICEDEPLQREALLSYLQKMGRELGLEYKLQLFSSGEELLSGLEADTQLLLLDILMGGISGVEAAKKIRQTNKNLGIIFLTSATQYALDGYSVRAFGFMEKPVNYARFRFEVSEAIHSFSVQSGKTITLTNGKNKDIVNSSDILCVEVYGHYLNVTTLRDRRRYLMPISAVEEMLDLPNFYRCHKSYLVNFQHIQKILPGEIKLKNGDIIPVSKHRYRDMMDAFTRYMGNQSQIFR